MVTVYVFGGDGEEDEVAIFFKKNTPGNIARQLGLGTTIVDCTLEPSRLQSIILKCSICSQLSSEHFD